jgi:hypothetical protein
MAWKGVPGDQRIFFARTASFVGTSWPQPKIIDGIGTSSSPTLAVFQGKLHMLWKGVEGDQRIFANEFDGQNQSPQRLLSTNLASLGPFLATFNSKAIFVHKGAEGNNKIFSSFPNPHPIAGIGTSSGPTLGQLGSWVRRKTRRETKLL